MRYILLLTFIADTLNAIALEAQGTDSITDTRGGITYKTVKTGNRYAEKKTVRIEMVVRFTTQKLRKVPPIPSSGCSHPLPAKRRHHQDGSLLKAGDLY